MRLLLDTHVLFWWLIEESQLSPTAHAAIKAKGNEVNASVATAWEMAIKTGLGKWPEAEPLVMDFEQQLANNGIHILPISIDHARVSGMMRNAHRDPFDRLLAAQAQIEGDRKSVV